MISAVALLGCGIDGTAEEVRSSAVDADPADVAQTDPPPSTIHSSPDAGSEDSDSPELGDGEAVSGPLMRYPVRSNVEEGMAAEVRGILELDDGCLYLNAADIGCSHGDDDFPLGVSVFEIPECVRDLAQRVGPVDDRRHLR